MKNDVTKLTPGLRGRSKSGNVAFGHDGLIPLNQAGLLVAQTLGHTPSACGEPH